MLRVPGVLLAGIRRAAVRAAVHAAEPVDDDWRRAGRAEHPGDNRDRGRGVRDHRDGAGDPVLLPEVGRPPVTIIININADKRAVVIGIFENEAERGVPDAGIGGIVHAAAGVLRRGARLLGTGADQGVRDLFDEFRGAGYVSKDGVFPRVPRDVHRPVAQEARAVSFLQTGA